MKILNFAWLHPLLLDPTHFDSEECTFLSDIHGKIHNVDLSSQTSISPPKS